MRGRDDELRAALPPKHAPYSFDSLSESETALEASLGDGFGDVGADGYLPMPMPPEIKGGLIKHNYFVNRHSEYDHQEYPDEFWDWRDDRPPPSEELPLGFVIRRLRLYFTNQLDRFCAQVIKDEPAYEEIDRDLLEGMAADRLYEKAWYEFHAVRLISWMEPEKLGTGGFRTLPFIFATSFSGKLGRLVEQYYWKFRFEKAAITGIGARLGASAGGKIKAKAHLAEHSAWQTVATEIWTSNSKLTKTAVAKAVKARLRVPQTAKHIARFITRP